MSTSSTRPLRPQPKLQAACVRLTELAQRLGPDAKLPTVVELCNSLNLSLRTLTGAVAELEKRDVLYGIQGSGIYVSPRLRKSIALICDPAFFRDASGSSFWDLVVESARARAADTNEAFSFHFATPSGYAGAPLQDSLKEELKNGRIQGVLCIGASEATPWLESEGVPHVVFAGKGQWSVQLDNRLTTHLGVSALINQGCRRIGLWNAVLPYFTTTPSMRQNVNTSLVKDFRHALETGNLTFDGALVENNQDVIVPGDGVVTHTLQEQGYQTAFKVFGKPRSTWPDGIVMTNDLMTHGALVAMHKMSIEIGSDIQIATHANRGSRVFLGDEKYLSLIEFDPAEVVRAMFGMLETLMEGRKPPVSPILICPHLKS